MNIKMVAIWYVYCYNVYGKLGHGSMPPFIFGGLENPPDCKERGAVHGYIFRFVSVLYLACCDCRPVLPGIQRPEQQEEISCHYSQ